MLMPRPPAWGWVLPLSPRSAPAPQASRHQSRDDRTAVGKAGDDIQGGDPAIRRGAAEAMGGGAMTCQPGTPRSSDGNDSTDDPSSAPEREMGKKSDGVNSMPARRAFAETTCLWRSGMLPADFQLWIVDGGNPVASAIRRVPPNRSTIRSTYVIPSFVRYFRTLRKRKFRMDIVRANRTYFQV